jgi:hypothetical protein
VIEKYRPSNGTDSEDFFASWCCHCQRDRAMREGCSVDECDDNERCDIIARTMALDVDDPDYPEEWQYNAAGRPCCTAFVSAGEPVPERCQHTADMFEVSP